MTEQACQGPTFFLVNAYAEKSLYSRRLGFEVVDTRFCETGFFFVPVAVIVG
jgi:hypothetical protein